MAGPLPVPAPLPVLGFPVVPFDSYAQAVQCVEQAVLTREKLFWAAINPEKIQRGLRDPELRQALGRIDAGICDGIGVSLAAKLLHGRMIPRCTGVDLFFALLAAAAEKGWGVFLLGASPQSSVGAQERLARAYPRLRIVGRQDGYFKDSHAVVRQVNDSGADLLFVAMGSPRQELWIASHRQDIHACFCLGVGGSFDVASGRSRRAPRIVRMAGMEFLYRALTTPGWGLRTRWQRTYVKFQFAAQVVRWRLDGASRRCRAGPV